MTSLGLALTMLWHQKTRTALYVVGVLGAALLLFLQYGFQASLKKNATQFVDAFQFDLAIVSGSYHFFNNPGTFPRQRLDQARTVAGVAEVIPLQISLWRWPTRRTPGSAEQNLTRDYVFVLATEPAALPRLFSADRATKVFGSADGATMAAQILTHRSNILMDTASRSEYVPTRNGKPWIGKPGLIGREEAACPLVRAVGPLDNPADVRLVGGFEVGTGFAANAVLLTSIATLEEINRSHGTVSLGLIQLDDRTNAVQVAKTLRKRLPGDVFVFTRAELAKHETTHWTENLPVGRFFQVGGGVAFIVGMLFIYQMMVGDIRKHIGQYATLKALGYDNRYLARVVLWQGLLLAILGYLPSTILAWGLLAMIRAWTRLPMFLTPELLFWVFLPTFVICLGSALWAVRKVYQADPADLF